jgi:uncharacterized protein (DUF433 family)
MGERLAGLSTGPGQLTEEDDMAVSKQANPETSDVEIKELGKYVISHPLICHGNLTIRGTRILVSVILEQIADGEDWDAIERSWNGKVPREAIFEIVLLARDALIATTNEGRTATALGLLPLK